MLKLKEIINQLSDDNYKNLQDQFTKTKANNFLYLLNTYRRNGVDDDDIVQHLDLNKNAFYVLKSRLYDKIQTNLNEDIDVKREDVYKQLSELKDICINEPRNIAIAKLNDLEQKLMHYELYTELVNLYSLLKRIHLYSDKYYYFSQQYNKFIAYSLSQEKSLDILDTFNTKLNQYLFSKNSLELEELMFLYKEIDDYCRLNENFQLKLIRSLFEIQLNIFCDKFLELDIPKLIQGLKIEISDLPESSGFTKYIYPLDILLFEFYVKTGQNTMAAKVFPDIEGNINKCLLSNSMVCPTVYLTSKLSYLLDTNNREELIDTDYESYSLDPYDKYSLVRYNIFAAMINYLRGSLKEGSLLLNKTLNEHSFKDLLNINAEIKLLQTYFSICNGELDYAENIIKNLLRKIKSEETPTNPVFATLIKFFNRVIKHGGFSDRDEKQKELLKLFIVDNTGINRTLNYLIPELKFKLKI